MPAPVAEDASPPDGSETFNIRQMARLRRLSLATLASWVANYLPAAQKGDKGDRGNAGPQGDTGAAGSVGATGAVGPKGDVGSQGAVGAVGAKGDTGAVGATGAVGTPKRVERYTTTTNASSIAAFTFSPAFTAVPDVDFITGWIGDQEVGGAISSVSLTGCTATAKMSRATLLLSAGPYQPAGAGVSVTIKATGN